MQRITESNIAAVIKRLNVATNSPLEPYSLKEGKYVANVGCWYVEETYGGYQLSRIVNEAGGAEEFGGSGTRRDLWDRVQHMLDGIKVAPVQRTEQAI